MRKADIFPVWGRILRGHQPFLSIEITKECPLRCPGCYAYSQGHIPNGSSIRSLTEWQGDALVERVMDLVRRFRPLHLSIVGGEPLIRYKELTRILGHLAELNIETQIVTSAILPIPQEWARFSNLHLAVSVDGLREEHDLRRAPATYDRILANIDGQVVIVHCTIIPQFLDRPDYLEDFVRTWSLRGNVRKIWFSLFTPQKGDFSPLRLTAAQRDQAIERISDLQAQYPKLYAPRIMLHGYRQPPDSPAECIFAQITRCVASDLQTPVVPCQIGGNPECRECGCVASAGLASIGKLKLAGLLKLSDIFAVSKKFGKTWRAMTRHNPKNS